VSDLRNALADDGARARAAADLDRNLVVVAGAGTGKTSLLIERVLTGIGTGAFEMDDVAAITFTEKAAGEMRQRLAVGLDRLRALACGEGTEGRSQEARHVFERLGARGVARDEIARLSLRGIEQLESAKILTIHSFCSELLREHPVEARVAPDFRVDRGEHAREIFEEEWERFLSVELGRDAARAELWDRLLARSRLTAVREAARRLGGFGVPVPLLGESPAEAERVLVAEARVHREEIEDALGRVRGLTNAPETFLRKAVEALRTLEDRGPEALREFLTWNPWLLSKEPSKATDKVQNVPKKRINDLGKSAQKFLECMTEIDEPYCRDLVEALRPFAISFRERMLERGYVSFDGLLSLARDLLRDHPSVRDALKSRFRMLLVDEFQDTDPLQYEIVLYLAEREGESSANAYECELADGRLFVVGDPKQSIYRFRGADFSAFLRAIEKVARDDERLHLVSNFRSVPAVLAPVNALFAAPFWTTSAYQPGYEAIVPTKVDPGGPPRVEVWTVGAREQRAQERRVAEGDAIAARIDEFVRTRRYEYRDVFVLLRAFTALGPYVRPLRARGIPFVVDGGREFLERTEVVQLLAALRSLAQPADAVALLAYLRSPAGAVPDTELAGYASAKGFWDWTTTPDAVRFPGVARAFALLRRLREETRDMPVDSVVRAVAAATHLVPLAAFGYEGAQRVANLRKLLASAAEIARDGSLSFLETLEAIDTQSQAELEGDSPLADEATDAVRIATIHRAKGLENKVVFVPDLARDDRRFGFRPEAETDVVGIRGSGPALALRIGDVSNAAWVVREIERKRHEDAEDVRLLYVALTRAQEHLVVVAGKSPRVPAWVQALEAWGYDPAAPPANASTLANGTVLHRLISGPSPRAVAEADLPDDVADAVERYESVATALDAAKRPPFATPSGAAEDVERARWAPDARNGPARDVARVAGIAVHRALQHADFRSKRFLDALPAYARAAAAEEGADPARVEKEARAILEAFARSPLFARLREVEILGREIPLLFRDAGGASWRGSIDLLFRDTDGTLVVADFKTDVDTSGALDRYHAQLEVYAASARDALETPAVRAELWMLRSGDVLRIEERPAERPPAVAVTKREKRLEGQRRLF
jgi:ATP-dependent helicase/nuclease subunit A